MLKQLSSGRNQKAKGSSKLKALVQICLLIAIGIWLVNQAKHFINQKTAFAEDEVVDQEYPAFKLGRKSLLNPPLGDLARGFQKLEEEEEEEGMEISEDDENKLREQEEEDDEIGVGNQEKTEEGAEHEPLEDLIEQDDSED